MLTAPNVANTTSKYWQLKIGKHKVTAIFSKQNKNIMYKLKKITKKGSVGSVYCSDVGLESNYIAISLHKQV